MDCTKPEVSPRLECSAKKRGQPPRSRKSMENNRCRPSQDLHQPALAKTVGAAVSLDSMGSENGSGHATLKSTQMRRIGSSKSDGSASGAGADGGSTRALQAQRSKSASASGDASDFPAGTTSQLRSPKLASSVTTTGDEGNGSKGEGLLQAPLSEAHYKKRRAIAAALARSTFARLRKTNWEDVDIDWRPQEHLLAMERRVCSLLRVDTLGPTSVKDTTSHGGAPNGPGAGVAAAASGSTEGADSTEEKELLMSSVFPLPPPKPPRHIKNGVFANLDAPAEPKETRAVEASATRSHLPFPPRIQRDGSVPEGYLSPLHIRLADRAARVDGSKADEALTETDAVGEGVPGDDTDGDSVSTSTTVTVDSNLTQYKMTAAERSRAYKDIFRGGGEKAKKRPRSPVARTPLRLPFPMAPRGGVGSSAAYRNEELPWGGVHGLNESDSEGVLKSRGDGSTSSGGAGTATEEPKVDPRGKYGDHDVAGALRHRNFRLPYDIMYEYQQDIFYSEVRQLGVRSTADAMEEFKNITSNVYISKKPPVKDAGEDHKCHCKPPPDGQPGCTETCSNRATNEECTSRTCGLGGSAPCDNRKMQRHKQEDMKRLVLIKDVGAKGIGLAAKRLIPAGSLIGEYVGEVMSEDDWQERQATLGDKQRHKYVMDLGDGEVVDASQSGSILRFVNHSCGPNAETQKWTIQGKQRVGLFATDDILKGEEVTFNYCYVRYDEEARECLCGHPSCVKTLGTKHGKGDKEAGAGWSSRGTGSCSGAGGGGPGNGVHGRGGRRGRLSPKWEDPETGETVRPWLHTEDAENIERLTIRAINHGGRPHARDLAVGMAKRLFLKRNISLACRRLVAEQAALVAPASAVGAAGKAKSNTSTADARSRLRRLQASIARERALCEALGEANQKKVTGERSNQPRDAILPQNPKPSIISAAATDAGGARSSFNRTSTSRTRLFVREMQEEVLRVGREVLRTKRCGAPDASSPPAAAAANGPCATVAKGSGVTDSGKAGSVTGRWVRRGRSQGAASKTIASAAAESVPTEGNGGGEAPIRQKEGVVAPGRDKDGKAGKEKSLSRARDPRRRLPLSRESGSLHSQRFQMRKETNDEERDERVYSGSMDRYRRRSPSPRKSFMSDNSHYAAEEGRDINRECVRSRSRGSPRRSNSRKESRHSPCLVDRSVTSDEGGKTTIGRRRRSRPSLDSASSGSSQGQGESAARSRSPRLEAKGSQDSRTKAADDKRGGSASRSRSKLSMAANSRERGSRGRGRSNPDDRVQSENSLSSGRLSSQNRIRNLRSQECRSRNRDDDRTSSGHAAGSDSSRVSIGAKAVNPDNDDAEVGVRGDGEGSGVEPLREREISPSRLPTASPRAAEDPRRAGEAAKETETFPGVGEKDGAYSSDSDDSVTFVPALRSVKAKYGDDFYKVFRVEAMERLEEEKEVIRVEEGQRLGTMPPSESPSKKARDITGVMIPRATRKLPREVHRKILDMFQVVILEPLYYPPRSETPPTYVIGPVAHVVHAHRLLSDFHSRKLEVSMNNVLKAGMFVTLDIRRVDPGDGFLKRPTSYDITQEEAEALLDRGRLAWLLGECKRVTGAVKVCVSKKQWARNVGPAVCKVTVEGTKRQKDEAWQIVKSALEGYPFVEDFMRRFPPPWPSPGDTQEGFALQATAEARKEIPPPSPPVTSAPARPRLGFGAGIRMRAEAAAAGAGAATLVAPSFTMAASDGSPSRAAGNAVPVKGGSQSTSSVSGPVAEWEDGWALPVDVVQNLCSQQRTGLYPFGSASKSGLPRGSTYRKTCNDRRRRTEGKGLSPNNSRSRSTKSVRERGAPTRTREVAVKGAGSREDGGSCAGHGETNPAVVAPLSKAARGGKRNPRCKPRDRPPNGEHGGDGGEEEATQEEALFSLKVKALAEEMLSSTPSRNGASRAVVCSATSAGCGAQTIPSFESHATPLDGEAFAHPVSLEKKPPSRRAARTGSGTTAVISGSKADSQSTVEHTPVAPGADRERGGVTTSGEGGKPLVSADVEATPKLEMEEAPSVVRVGTTAVIPEIETRPATSIGTDHEGRLPVMCSQEKRIPIAPADVGVTPVGGLGETPSVIQVATASVTPRPMVTDQSVIGQNPVTSSEAGGVSTTKRSKEPGKPLVRENVDVTPADAMEEAPYVVQVATEKTVGAEAKSNGRTTERRLELSTASSPTFSSSITERKRVRALANTDATATKKAKQGEGGVTVGVCFGKEAAAFAAAVSKRLAHASGGGAAKNLVAAAAVGDVISSSKPTHESTVVQLTASTSSLRSSVVLEAAAKLAARLASIGKDAFTIAGTLPDSPRSTEKKLWRSRDDGRGNNSDEGPGPSAVRAANASSGMPDTESRNDDSSLRAPNLDAHCSRQASSPRRERSRACEGRRRRGREMNEEPHGVEDSGASEADSPSGILSRRRSRDGARDRFRTRKRDRTHSRERGYSREGERSSYRSRSWERFHRRSSSLGRQKRRRRDGRGRERRDRSPREPDRSASPSNYRRDGEAKRDRVGCQREETGRREIGTRVSGRDRSPSNQPAGRDPGNKSAGEDRRRVSPGPPDLVSSYRAVSPSRRRRGRGDSRGEIAGGSAAGTARATTENASGRGRSPTRSVSSSERV